MGRGPSQEEVLNSRLVIGMSAMVYIISRVMGVCITVAFTALRCKEGIRQTCIAAGLSVCAVLKIKIISADHCFSVHLSFCSSDLNDLF